MVSLQKKKSIAQITISPSYDFPVKIAEKGTLFIFGQKTEKVVSNQAILAFFNCPY